MATQHTFHSLTPILPYITIKLYTPYPITHPFTTTITTTNLHDLHLSTPQPENTIPTTTIANFSSLYYLHYHKPHPTTTTLIPLP